MNRSISTLLGLALLSFVSGCSGATDTPETGSPPAPAPAPVPSSASSAPPSAGSSSTPSAPGASANENEKPTDQTKPGADEPRPDADPACVASCNTNVKTKCEGDDTFCADICSGMTTAQVTCIGTAPTCEKSEWLRCVDQNPGK